MPKLKPGSMIIDLVDGSIHGDLDHCPKQDLLESAQALLSLLTQVQHKGLWGLGKPYDREWYIFTSSRAYKGPQTTVALEAYNGQAAKPIVINWDRDAYWKGNGYSKPLGKIEDGEVTDSIEGVTDHHIPRPAPTVIQPEARPSVRRTQRKPRPGENRVDIERPRLF